MDWTVLFSLLLLSRQGENGYAKHTLELSKNGQPAQGLLYEA